MITRVCSLLAVLLTLMTNFGHASEAAYQPKAEKVVDGVFAIVGPLGQRSLANAGLNANYGFIVTA